MTDLREAAEQALDALENHTAIKHPQQIKYRDDAIEALRQALDDKPAVKTYAGGKPNYCTPVDAVNISQERVDEMAKGQHEPECVAVIGNWGKVEWKEGVFPQLGDKLYTAPPISDYHEGWEEGFKAAKREWVGLTKTERFEIEVAMSKYYDYQHECKTVCLPEFAAAIEAKLKEKNT